MPAVVLNKFFPTDILLENVFISGHANNSEFKYLRYLGNVEFFENLARSKMLYTY